MRFQVEGCCCCFGLETGVKIIGFIELIVGVLCVVFGGMSLGGDVLAATVTSVQGVISIIVGVFTIFGVLKEKPNYFLPFLASMTIGIIKYAIEFCVTINQALSQEKVDSSKFIGELFAEILVIGLGIYFLLVVYTLYKSMKGGLSSMNNAGMP